MAFNAAKVTVAKMIEDLSTGTITPAAEPGRETIDGRLAAAGLKPVSFSDWQRLDAAEVERGEKVGKVREKFTRVDEMLRAIADSDPT